MSPKLLVIFGATGQQGGSVLDYVLNDPDLSKEYKIRAITRDPTSESAQKLLSKASKATYGQEIELVRANLLDFTTLETALEGAHTIFAQTPAVFGTPTALETEFTAGKHLADTAVAAGVSYIIFSTLPNVSLNSHGKYTKVHAFDAKAQVEAYIRTLPVPSAFFAAGSFMQNWNQPWMTPKPSPTDKATYVISRHTSPSHRLPLIDIVADTGKFVGSILSDPPGYQGRTLCSATRLYSMREIAEIMSDVTGRHVVYRQITVDEYRKNLPPWGESLVEMMMYQEEFGYYGEDTERKVKWARENARGQVVEFEEYLRLNPLKLAPFPSSLSSSLDG